MSREALRRMTRKFSDIRGLRRIPEFFQKKFSWDDTTFTIRDFDSDLSFQSRFSSHIGSHVYWMGCYSRSVLLLLSRVLRDPSAVIIDVGANEGEETLFCAKRVSAGRVYAFEPNSAVRALLERNVALNNFNNVSIEPIGLADKPGKLTLYGPSIRHSDGTLNDGQATLYQRPGVDHPIQEVALTTLDTFAQQRDLQRLDLLKIDVEGAELAVLKGGEKVLARFRPKLILEVWEGADRSLELLRLVSSLGYTVFNIKADGSYYKADDLRFTTRDVFCSAGDLPSPRVP